MTLVAVLFADETPLIVTDALVSNTDSDAPGAPSPLLQDPDRRPGQDGMSPVGLARKYWILPDGTFFFYAGTIREAWQVFDALHDRMSRGALSRSPPVPGAAAPEAGRRSG